MLFNGDFEMLERYKELKEILMLRINSLEGDFFDFMSDKRNYFSPRKRERLQETEIYRRWKAIRSKTLEV